ncbi:MAG: S1/P1 nuclease [Gammaproteobacteria bacterium]|nr:S1/P1 nuclease [Gammaproteobacteria bacterium]
MRRLAQLIVIHACAFLYVSSTYAYGSLGHEIVGEIAWQNLCEPAQVEVELLLGDESLGEASRWPDWIRGEREWAHTRTWHYINVADEGSLELVLNSNDSNVITAIEWSRAQLADDRLSAEKQAQALRFLAHFVADVHQPLHVGRAEDRGGNRIAVRVDGRKTNLHKLWDAQWLLRTDRKAANYRRDGQVEMISQFARFTPESGEVLDWARESQALRAEVYALPAAADDGVIVVDEPYLAAALDISRIRLAEAGVRLAGELNTIYCDASDTP